MGYVMENCNTSVFWWDGEYEGECRLPLNHIGPHFDGISYYIGSGQMAEQVENPVKEK